LKVDLVIDLNKWGLKELELPPTTLDTLSLEIVHLSSSSSSGDNLRNLTISGEDQR
jgi:hypothetical protein